MLVNYVLTNFSGNVVLWGQTWIDICFNIFSIVYLVFMCEYIVCDFSIIKQK